jgi:hypothetical protein
MVARLVVAASLLLHVALGAHPAKIFSQVKQAPHQPVRHVPPPVPPVAPAHSPVPHAQGFFEANPLGVPGLPEHEEWQRHEGSPPAKPTPNGTHFAMCFT